MHVFFILLFSAPSSPGLFCSFFYYIFCSCFLFFVFLAANLNPLQLTKMHSECRASTSLLNDCTCIVFFVFFFPANLTDKTQSPYFFFPFFQLRFISFKTYACVYLNLMYAGISLIFFIPSHIYHFFHPPLIHYSYSISTLSVSNIHLVHFSCKQILVTPPQPPTPCICLPLFFYHLVLFKKETHLFCHV